MFEPNMLEKNFFGSVNWHQMHEGNVNPSFVLCQFPQRTTGSA